jgi:NTP pyrophosphatase (non-canonical NTP hydrolase)
VNESLLYASCPTRRPPVNYPELIVAVESWAEARQITKHSTPQAQLMKTVSELGELADATLKNDKAGIVDGLGDVLVTLIIYARLQGLLLNECLASAYETIKDRRGTLTAEGVFVKE